MEKECIFCNEKKYNKKILEKLIECLELRAVNSIKKATILKNCFTMLSFLSQDLIASEGHYHKSCYIEYTQKVESLSTSSNESQSSSGTNFYKDVELEAFREIVKDGRHYSH